MARELPTLRNEQRLADSGLTCVAGLDEVGRGAGAGPVTVGLVTVSAPFADPPALLADSKLLTAPQRVALTGPIINWVDGYAVASASPREVDDLGVVAALTLAAERAVSELYASGRRFDVLIVDGTDALLELDVPVEAMVKADVKCATVAAASVLAKVERDHLMRQLARQWPEYGFERNCGYPTPGHKAAVQAHGMSPHHRRSWAW